MKPERTLPTWRSLLYVPVNVDRFVDKAHTRGADGIILDLEDSIAPSAKAEARTMVPAAAKKVGQAGADVLVRINRPWRLAVRDIEESVCADVDALALPKLAGPDHVQLIDEVVTEVEEEKGVEIGHTKFVAMIETADAFLHMEAIAKASDRIVALNLGGEDFTAALGMANDADALYLPKMQIVVVAGAAGVLPMGFIGSIADFNDVDGFRKIVERSQRLGFAGAAGVHPNQIKVLNDVYRPSEEAVDQARRMIAAYEEAYAKGVGAVVFEGKMIDVPLVERARGLIRRYEAIVEREARAKG